MDMKQVTGYAAALFLAAIIAYVNGFVTCFGNWVAVASPAYGDIIYFGELVLFLAAFGIGGGVLFGYWGKNNKVDGLFMGIIIGAFVFSVYLLMLIFIGGLTLTIDLSTAVNWFYIGVFGLATFLLSGVIYLETQKALQ